jgi:hypothetical protein
MTQKLVFGLSLTLCVLIMLCITNTSTLLIAQPDSFGVHAAEPVTEPKTAYQSGTITITNNILDVSVEDVAEGGGIGAYIISTGSAHPIPGQAVFYDGWTSFTTIKVVDTLTEYVTANHSPLPSEGYTLDWLDLYHWSITASEDDRKVTSIWSIEEGLRITQVIEITGTTISDTLVRISVNVFNQAEVPYTVGIRQEWDIMIDGEDGSYLRPWSDLGQPLTWLDVETDWTLPDFQFWETTNNTTEPLFSIYGSISSPAEASPSPTTPDHFVFASWGDSYDYAYDYVPSAQNIGGEDSAILYYWEPVELLPNAAREITSYVTTFKEAIESEGGIYRQPIQSIRLAEVVVVAGVVTAATTVLTSLTALGQAFNTAIDLLPIPSKLRSFMKLYGKKTFESVDKVQLDALEKGSFISKQDLISLGLYILITTLVYGFVQANGFPRFFDPSVLAVVIPPTLISVSIVSVTSELTAALCAKTNQVYRQFRLWFYGLTSFLISGLILLFPFASPGITRYQSREISAKTKGLIVLFKMLVTLTLAIPFATLHMLGYTIIGDVGLLMILMRVCYSLVPVRPLAGRAVFDYSKEISLIALLATGILFLCYSMYLLPYVVYLAFGLVSAFLAVKTFNQLRTSEKLLPIIH